MACVAMWEFYIHELFRALSYSLQPLRELSEGLCFDWKPYMLQDLHPYTGCTLAECIVLSRKPIELYSELLAVYPLPYGSASIGRTEIILVTQFVTAGTSFF